MQDEDDAGTGLGPWEQDQQSGPEPLRPKEIEVFGYSLVQVLIPLPTKAGPRGGGTGRGSREGRASAA